MRKTLYVIIKGDKDEAAKAASARNIPFVFGYERAADNETHGQVSAEHIDTLAAWFHDPISEPFNARFLTGALLYYSPYPVGWFAKKKNRP